MKHHYCSAFSGDFCHHALILYDSLIRFDGSFTIFFICLDNSAYEILSALKLEHVELVKIEQLEAYYPELKAAKRDRALNEYAWTIKPCEILYIFENYKDVDRIIWLDSDIQLLSDSEAIYEEWGNNSIILTEQYYTGWHEPLVKSYGRFQAGFVGFKSDSEGLKCLKWWQSKCMEWCYVQFEEGRWTDQKYLDELPELCKSTSIVKSLGVNMTPFILYRYNYEENKYIEESNGELFINDIKIVLFHYYGFRYYEDAAIELCKYWMKFTQNTMEYVYLPYIAACKTAIKRIEAIKPNYSEVLDYKGRKITNYYDLTRTKVTTKLDIATIVRQETLQESLALYSSLSQHEDSFYWWVCCFDEESYITMKLLQIPNTTVINIDSLLDSTLSTEVKSQPDKNNMELLKTHFLRYLLKNGFDIHMLIFISSSFYLFTGLDIDLEQYKDYNSLLFKRSNKSLSKQITAYEKDFIGLINCTEVIEFLQYCVDMPRCAFRLSDKIMKHLKPNILSGFEYCSTYYDLKYNKIAFENAGLYINQNLVKGFHFIDNEKQKDGSTCISKKARLYLNNDIYNYIYDKYDKALSKVKDKILSLKNKHIALSGGKEMKLTDRPFDHSNVLITGASGFIGSHIVQRMVHEGARVFIIVRENSDLWRIEHQLADVNMIKGDLKNDEMVMKCVETVKPDYVFHMAAYGVDFRQQDYTEAAKSNILGTINLLNAVRRNGGCNKFLYSGTSMQYGNKEGVITEEMKLVPANIYGSTKAAATLIAHQIAGENDIPVTTLIPFGVFGENEGSHKFFPHIILSILDGKDVDLTNCEQYRDYCYIDNIVDGFLTAALDKKHINDIYNIGSGTIYQLRSYVDLIFKYMNTECKPNYGALEYRKNDLWHPQPDVSKIMDELHWLPRITLEDGLQRTINWYRDNYYRYKEKRR